MSQRSIHRWLTIGALAIASTIALAIPTGASATVIKPCPIYNAATDATAGISACQQFPADYPTAPLSYIGWTYLNLNYCPAGAMCALAHHTSMPAWKWTGSAWKQTTLADGRWVYTYPYTGSWRWAWTQEGGWVAVTGGRFEIRSGGLGIY